MMDPAAGIVCLLGGDSETLSVRQWGKEGKVQVEVWFGARYLRGQLTRVVGT